MAKRVRIKKARPALLSDADGLKEAGTKTPASILLLTMQAVEALWNPKGTSEEDRSEQIQSTITMLLGIKPTDEIEGMLAAQMVATHSAAMDCLRRAILDGQTFEGRDQNLKHAAKLMAIYARQIDALNKNRGKGQQKVTVEHVHVAAGGQAVVGNIEAAAMPSRSGNQSQAIPKAITHAPQEPFEINSRTRVPTKQLKK